MTMGSILCHNVLFIIMIPIWFLHISIDVILFLSILILFLIRYLLFVCLLTVILLLYLL